MICTRNPDPISGVRSASDTPWFLFCADDGGYWWVSDRHGRIGPIGLGKRYRVALDEAFTMVLP